MPEIPLKNRMIPINLKSKISTEEYRKLPATIKDENTTISVLYFSKSFSIASKIQKET